MIFAYYLVHVIGLGFKRCYYLRQKVLRSIVIVGVFIRQHVLGPSVSRLDRERLGSNLMNRHPPKTAYGESNGHVTDDVT